MPFNRRQALRFAGAALCAPAVPRAARGQAQVTLKLHHFLSSVSNAHTRFLVPWAKKIEADCENRIKIDIFPSMQLGGTPAKLYDQVREGAADLAWAVPANTPGRFPIIEVFELPFVSSRRAVVTSKALHEFFTVHLKDEFADTHPLFFWAHDRGVLHTRVAVRRQEDLRGLKLRHPTRRSGEALAALGATPIGLPLPLIPQALAQKAIDGCLNPWEVVPALKLQELVQFHTEISGSSALYTTAFVLAMNKAKYEAMPPDLRRAIDQNSGIGAAENAAALWDSEAPAVVEMVARRGNAVITLDEDEVARWRRLTGSVVRAWSEELKGRGADATKLLETARNLIAKYETA
jgi:TRAP-type C4-dicarboxylate transport system substrate-binding protein